MLRADPLPHDAAHARIDAASGRREHEHDHQHHGARHSTTLTPSPVAVNARAVYDWRMPPWSLPRRLGFRFAFAYVVLYFMPFPFEWIPGAVYVAQAWRAGCVRLVLGVAHLFGIAVKQVPDGTGSGDTTYSWLQAGCMLALAIVATAAWSIADRRRARYDRLEAGLRLYARGALAVAMLSYGLAKLFVAQFPFPSAGQLAQPLGELSRQRLLWVSMGASPAYSVFTGAAETLGGLLLLFNRTVPLGALVSFACLANVVALNFCYDVPVKQYSMQLLLLSMFLLAPSLPALATVVCPRPTAPSPRWLTIGRFALAAWLVFAVTRVGLDERQFARGVEKGTLDPLAGTWFRDETDAASWRRLDVTFYVDRLSLLAHRGDDTTARFRFAPDELRQKVTLTPPGGGAPTTFALAQPDRDHLVLDGVVNGVASTLRWHRAAATPWPLATEHGFHFVTERP